MIGGQLGRIQSQGMGGSGSPPVPGALPQLQPAGIPGANPGSNGQGAGASTNSMGPSQEDVFGLLKNNLLRRFKVDIETDSTIAGDESQEKQDRTTFIESMTKFMEAWGPMVIQRPELAQFAGQLLLFGVRAFRTGRELEESIEELSDKLAQPSSTQKEPDPKVQAEQIKLQGAQMKTQAEVQKSQVDAQTGQQEAAAKLQEIITSSQAKIAEAKMKLAAMEQAHGHKLAEGQMAHGAAMDAMALERQKAQTAQQQAQMPKWPVDPGKTQGF